MRAKRTVGSLTVALLSASLFALAGCGDTITMSDPSAVDDEETLRGYLEDDGIFDDMGPYEAGQVTFGGADGREAIDPLTFWRVITDRACYREITHDPETGTAEVTVHREIWGDLHIVDEGMAEYVKPFHHTGIRYATFVRDPDWEPPHGGQGTGDQDGNAQGQGGGKGAGDQGGNAQGQGDGGQGDTSHNRYRRGPWILTELSGFRAESDTLTIAIDWIRVQSATVDVTITDPLELMAVPDEVMAFEVGEEVTVTVSGPPEGAVLFLHTRHWKSPFVYDGAGAFVGTWTVMRPGRHTAWVEAMAHDTLYDSEHPEDTLIWGVPYVVDDGEIEE